MPVQRYNINLPEGDSFEVDDPFYTSANDPTPTPSAPVEDDGMFQINDLTLPSKINNTEVALYDQAVKFMTKSRGQYELDYLAAQRKKYIQLLKTAPEVGQILKAGWDSSLTGQVLNRKVFDDSYTKDWSVSALTLQHVMGFASDAWLFSGLGALFGGISEAFGVGEKIASFVGEQAAPKIVPLALKSFESAGVLGTYGAINQIYIDALMNNWTKSPADFVASAGRALNRAVRDTALGASIGTVGGLFDQAAQDQLVSGVTKLLGTDEPVKFSDLAKTLVTSRLLKESGTTAEGLVFGLLGPLMQGKLPTKASVIQSIVDMYGLRAINSGPGVAKLAFKDMRDAYINDGITPKDIAERAKYDMSLLEDAANDTTNGFRILKPLQRLGDLGTRTIEIPDNLDPWTKHLLLQAKQQQEAQSYLKDVYEARKIIYDMRNSITAKDEVDLEKTQPEGVAKTTTTEGENKPTEGVAKTTTTEGENKPTEGVAKTTTTEGKTEAADKDVLDASDVVKLIEKHLQAGDTDNAARLSIALTNQNLLTLPDLVNLVHELSRGNYPEIKRNIYDDPYIQGAFISGDIDEKRRYTSIFIDPHATKIMLRSDLFKNPAEALATLSHEIGHFITWFPKAMMAEYPTDLMRMLSGFRDIHDLYQQAIDSGTISAEEALNFYDKVRNEAVHGSELWRPWRRDLYEEAIQDNTIGEKSKAYYNYRMSPRELSADTISIMLNQPELAKQIMPNATRIFFQYLDKRPEVKAAYDEMMESIREGANLKHAENRVVEGFNDAERRLAHKQLLDETRYDVKRQIAKAKFHSQFNSRFDALTNPKLLGYNLPKPVINEIQKYYHFDSITQEYTRQMQERVFKRMKSLKYSQEDVGLALFYTRIMKDSERRQLANSQGFTVAEATDRYNEMIKDKPFMEELTKAFYDVRLKWVLPEILKSDIVPERLKSAVIRNKDAYSKFFVNKFIDYEWGSGAASDMFGGNGSIIFDDLKAAEANSVGYLGEIANPFFMTIANDVSLMRAIKKQETINMVLDAVRAQTPNDVLTSEEYNNADTWPRLAKLNKFRNFYSPVQYIAFVDKTMTDPETGKVSKVYARDSEGEIIHKRDENGDLLLDNKGNPIPVVEQVQQKQAYYVLEPILDGFKNEAPAFATWMAGLAGGKILRTMDISNKLFRFLVITTNVGFITRNALFRDHARTIINLRGLGPARAYRLLPYIGDAYKDVFRYMYHKEMPQDIEHAIRNGLFSTVQNYEGRDTLGTRANEVMLQKYGARNALEDQNVLSNVRQLANGVSDFTEKLDAVNDFFEKANKLSAYKYLKANQDKLGLANHEVDMLVRMSAASPDFMDKGTGSHILNAFVPFANAIMKAYKGNWYAAKDIGLPAYAMRIGSSAVLLAVASAMAEKKLFDWNFWPDWAIPSEVLRTVTSYKKDHYFAVPLFVDSIGQGHALMFPLPDRLDFRLTYSVTRALTKYAIDKAQGGDMPAVNDIQQIYNNIVQHSFNFASNDLPNLSPFVQSLTDASHFLGGTNYYDAYKNRMKYTDKEVQRYKVHPEQGWRKFFSDELQLWGFSRDWMRFVGGDRLTARQEGDALSRVLGISLDNMTGSFVYVGDWGIDEHLQKERENAALFKSEAADKAAKYFQTGYISPEDKQFVEKYGSKAIIRNAKKREQRRQVVINSPQFAQSWNDRWLRAKKSEKLLIYKAAKANPSGRRWITWLKDTHKVDLNKAFSGN